MYTILSVIVFFVLLRTLKKMILAKSYFGSLAHREWVVLELLMPREITKTPRAMEVVLTTLHQKGLKDSPAWYSLEIASIGGTVHFYIVVDRDTKPGIETAVYAQYPTIEVVEVPDDAPWTLDVIEALRDKSLLRVSEPDELPGEVRFSMYESIRAYAAERLGELDPDEETVDRHASWVLAHCGELMGRLQGHGGLSNFLQLAVEADNLLAIQSRRRRSHPDQSLQATLLLEHVLRTRGPTSLHHRLLDEALEQASALDDDTVRARLHLAKGRALRVRGAVDEAKQELGRALPLFAGQEDADAITGELEALAVLATLNTDQGRIDEAEAIVQAALPQAEAAGLLRLRGLLTGLLAGHQLTRGHVGQAERLCTEAIQLLTEAGDEVSMATNLSTLGLLCAEVGRVDEARNYIERAQRIHRA